MLTDPNQRATTVKKTTYRNQCCLLKMRKKQSEDTQNNPGNINSSANNSIPNNNTNKINNKNNYKIVTEQKESQKMFIYPVRHVERQTTPRRIAIMEPMQPIDHLLGTKIQTNRIRSKKEPIKITGNWNETT